MKRRVSIAVWVSVLVVAFALSTFRSHAQGRTVSVMGVGMLCNIEGLWAEVAFTAKVADAKLLQMRPDFQKAWDARKEIAAKIASSGNITVHIKEMKQTFSELVDAVKKVLTEEEFAILSSWLERQQRGVGMMQEAMPGAAAAAVGAQRPQEE